MNGHLRTSWTLWVVKEHVIYGGTYCITDCLLITVYAYDHTIKASANRGKSIKYFKTGLGVGKNLKRLETLIRENNHTNSVIEYLKVLRILSAIYDRKSLFKDRHRVGRISGRRIQRLVFLWCPPKCDPTRYDIAHAQLSLQKLKLKIFLQP